MDTYNGLSLHQNASELAFAQLRATHLAEVVPPSVTIDILQHTEQAELDPLPEGYSLIEQVLIGCVLSFFIVLSTAGNILVCVAVVTERNLRKRSNSFIVSLAIADLLVAVLVMNFAVANDIMGYWIFGDRFCLIWISFDVMCCTSSILNLCAISLDRYIHIRNPLHYERWVTPMKLFWCLFTIWVLSVLISFVPIQLGWHQMGMTPPNASNSQIEFETTTSSEGLDVHGILPDQHKQVLQNLLEDPPSVPDPSVCMMSLSPQYAVLSSLVSFYFPCLVMILIYYQMYRYARRQAIQIKRSMKPCLHNSAENGTPKSGSAGYRASDHKAAITLGVIMGTFLFCWTPFFTINIIGSFCSSCIPPIVFSSVTWLGYFNSTLNPIIYSIFNVDFREAFKRVLKRIDPRKLHFSDCAQTVKKNTGGNIRRRKTGYNSVSSNITMDTKRCADDIITTV